MIRSFIAVDLSAEVLAGIDQVYRQLKQRLPAPAVRWTPVKNIHLTLKFLGDVSEANLPPLFAVLQREAEKRASFEIRVGSLGAFPSTRRPRVIWIGVQAPPELGTIQHAIDLETARLGYASEQRDFSPHLTLGRVSRQATPEEARQVGDLIVEMKTGELGACQIDTLHYYRSDLNPSGAVYTRLYTAAFKN